jgi:malonyl-CoA decarboxylase
MSLCAHYLLNEKRGDAPLDPVSRFHLRNGARLERINWLGDTSAKGIQESAGLLVNYVYDRKSVTKNHERYIYDNEVVTSSGVAQLAKRRG